MSSEVAKVTSGIKSVALGLTWPFRAVYSFVGSPLASWIADSLSFLITIGYGIWFIKLFWGVKLLPMIFGKWADFGTIVSSETSSNWIAYAALVFLTVNATSLAFADYRRKAVMTLDFITSAVPAAIISVAMVAYHFNTLGTLPLTGNRVFALHVFFWMCVVDTILFSLIAARLNRLYFGDIAGGGHVRG